MQTVSVHWHAAHKRQLYWNPSTMQIWFGISEYAKTGKYLEGRMRSHPLVVRLGTGDAPQMRDLWDVSMYELDNGFAKVQHDFGADLYKAADWRFAPILDEMSAYHACTYTSLGKVAGTIQHYNLLCITQLAQQKCGSCKLPAVLIRL